MTTRPKKPLPKLTAALVVKAYAGTVPWLDGWIKAAGYHRHEGMAAAAVARIWNVNARAVGQWASKMGCPRSPDRTFNLDDVVKWRESRNEAETDSGDTRRRTKAQNDLDKTKAAIARIDLKARQGSVLPKENVVDCLSLLEAILRKSGERLQRDFGPDAQQILNDGLDDFKREVDRAFGSAG